MCSVGYEKQLTEPTLVDAEDAFQWWTHVVLDFAHEWLLSKLMGCLWPVSLSTAAQDELVVREAVEGDAADSGFLACKRNEDLYPFIHT